MNYLIAYDIADPTRLRRVARACERKAIRCQKSVFWFSSTEAAMREFLTVVAVGLNQREDLVQVWRLASGETREGFVLGTPPILTPGGIVLAPHERRFVGGFAPDLRDTPAVAQNDFA
jgi:CRISPR-associated endonuclease Cas2